MATPTHGYHHGNLPEALLDAVADIVSERGVEGVSVRAAARHVGVSHTAPTHHFGDKRGMLTAFALRGFQRFRDALVAAGSDPALAPEEALRRCGHAYVRFAGSHRAYFEVMFRPELVDHDDPALSAAGEAAFGVLLDRVARCRRDGDPDDPETRRLAMAAWAMVHGLAELYIDGPLPHMDETTTLDGAFDATIPVLLDGLRATAEWTG